MIIVNVTCKIFIVKFDKLIIITICDWVSKYFSLQIITQEFSVHAFETLSTNHMALDIGNKVKMMQYF